MVPAPAPTRSAWGSSALPVQAKSGLPQPKADATLTLPVAPAAPNPSESVAKVTSGQAAKPDVAVKPSQARAAAPSKPEATIVEPEVTKVTHQSQPTSKTWKKIENPELASTTQSELWPDLKKNEGTGSTRLTLDYILDYTTLEQINS